MEDNLKALLAKRLKEIRESKGLSQRELAKILGRGRGNGTISNIEKGKSNVTIEKIEELAKALNISVVELLDFRKYKLEHADIIERIHTEYSMIPERVLKIFANMYDSGMRFLNLQDYYYLWVFMQAMELKDDSKK